MSGGGEKKQPWESRTKRVSKWFAWDIFIWTKKKSDLFNWLHYYPSRETKWLSNFAAFLTLHLCVSNALTTDFYLSSINGTPISTNLISPSFFFLFRAKPLDSSKLFLSHLSHVKGAFFLGVYGLEISTRSLPIMVTFCWWALEMCTHLSANLYIPPVVSSLRVWGTPRISYLLCYEIK